MGLVPQEPPPHQEIGTPERFELPADVADD